MASKQKPKKTRLSYGIYVPRDLARLLAAEPKQLKEPKKFAEVQAIAKSLLRLLLYG